MHTKIARKIATKKIDCGVFRYSVITDRYGNDKYGYEPNPSDTIHVMFVPISSEVEIKEYGERVNEMLHAALFEDTELSEKDRIQINGEMYNVEAIKNYPSYRDIICEKVR